MDEENLNRLVTVTLFDKERWDGEWMPETLTEAIAWLQQFLEQVPVEFRETATVDISGFEDYAARIEISYQRPPTDTEKQGRLAEERQLNKERENKERRQYERLKAKFGK